MARQKRANRKFKVLGVLVAILGLALIAYSFGALFTTQLPLTVAGIGMIILGGYLFIDEFRILEADEVT